MSTCVSMWAFFLCGRHFQRTYTFGKLLLQDNLYLRETVASGDLGTSCPSGCFTKKSVPAYRRYTCIPAHSFSYSISTGQTLALRKMDYSFC